MEYNIVRISIQTLHKEVWFAEKAVIALCQNIALGISLFWTVSSNMPIVNVIVFDVYL